MSKQQTAIEWLVQQYIDGNYSIYVYEQAKQMEKEHIINAYDDGSQERHNHPVNGEQYYNETYGTENSD